MNVLTLGCLALAGLLQMAMGGRLLWLWRSTRGAPELLLGLAWFVASVENTLYGASIAAGTAAAPHEVLLGATRVAGSVDVLVLFLAIAYLFRADARWMRPVVISVAGGIVVGWGFELFGDGSHSVHLGSVTYWVHSGLRLVSLVWVAAEAWRFHRTFRGRWLLGLSERLLVDRFWLWAGSAFTMSIFVAIELLARLFALPPALASVTQPALSMIAVTMMWVTFFPPAWMRRRANELAP